MWSARLFTFITLLSGLDVCCEGNSYSKRSADRITYPNAWRDMSVVDDFHGTQVHDPYRWLEDPDSDETKSFISAQNVISDHYFSSDSVMASITEKLTQARNYSRKGCPGHAGYKYYYFHNTGVQNQDVLYLQDTLDSESSVLLDPNLLSEDGTISLGRTQAFSPDGSILVYSEKVGGSDWVTIKVRNVSTGEDLSDTLDNVDYSAVAWTSDNVGFFYSAPNMYDKSVTRVFVNHSVFYHRLHTDKTHDLLAFHIPEHPDVATKAIMSDENNYVILRSTADGIKFKLCIADIPSMLRGMTKPEDHTCLTENLENYYQYVTSVDENIYIVTNKDAPYRKLVKVNINNPAFERWVTIVAESEARGLLYEAVPSGGKLVLHYLKAARSELYIHNLQTGAEEHKVDLEIGSIGCICGKTTDAQLFFKVTSFLISGIVYSLNVNSYDKTVLHQSTVNGLEPDLYETRQLFYNSSNGTAVPMFVVQRKGLALSGDHPVLLYGYGGFSLLSKPRFNFEVLVLLRHLGAVYAVANIRGGAEYGEAWHQGGMLGNKQNSFDDFQAAAQYLITSRYTNRNKIAIIGRSNGGLLVAACLNQRPDLFAAGVVEVGVLDMLRYYRFTSGKAWIPEYGSPDNSEHFPWLYRYSPLHNIPSDTTQGQYPATLVMTADMDDRVVPMHSLKFTAQLQHSLGNRTDQTNPLLLRVETDAGHGAGTPTSKIIAQKADIFSFLKRSMNLDWHD